MKRSQADQPNRDQGRKVISLRMDAGFFFERAVRSLDRYRYDKALKYFRLAVEKEPNNPVNQCNLAGILSEMGRFEESNEVLERILQEVDPHLHECYFYMANNCANVDDFEKAEELCLRYLEEDPAGEFAEEAEEMLDMLAYELGRQPRRPKAQPRNASLRKHEEARDCLEAGHFLRATRILEELVEEAPDFLAARNNLALAHYYTGELDRAVDTIREVLEKDPQNLHALCNWAVLCQHQGETKQRDQLVGVLKKWAPFHLEHTMKLATTMGVLGEHHEAYRLFRQLLKLDPEPDSSLFHYAAAAAFNIGEWNQARKHWRMARDLDPESEVPRFYLNQLAETEGSLQRWPSVSYHYQLPFEEQLLQLDRQQQRAIPDQIKQNPLIRSSFFWALNHGDRETKLQVLQVFEWIRDGEVEEVLRGFLMKEEEDDDLKRVALYVLREIGASAPYHARLGGREVMIQPTQLAQEMPKWLQTWRQVLDCCLKRMAGEYDRTQMNDAEIIWAEFLRQHHSNLPAIRKMEGWAAALEYVVAKLHGLSLTLEKAAGKHGVSSSTVGRHVRVLEEACRVYRNQSHFS
ncbi:tetratricopeptide repeat protein [Desmospora profundinema]|uniref:Tetratricopeptide (TPR) repeat protein n=1 Tax=Desmospora profundinema TaxID=1571184 RepID=A0ABU1ILM1_9BACL|nr:tetratricopeptide repeat protein [Desmospora profundinema]MDR6225638.1 tetratricopeptide (TPR) repeat protein [Desmospora profundinema]